MYWRVIRVMGMIVVLGITVSLAGHPSAAAHGAAPPPVPARTFVVNYTARLEAVPSGAKRLDVWLPVPASDAFQTIDHVQIETALPHRFETDKEYGNRVVHAWSDRPARADLVLRFRCRRLEQRAAFEAARAAAAPVTKPDERLLRPDRLGVIDDDVRALANRVADEKSPPLDQARAIYDYVLAHMAYDKQTPGWGRGDTHRACKVGRGNCTDFHSLFISLARARGIPCRFDIGFLLPADKEGGPVHGYHCWAEFWTEQTGWVPVDASEAWKHPQKRAFYFGSLDPDLVRMSTGRDLTLSSMAGEPLNFLIFPYAEADGKALTQLQTAVTFTAANVGGSTGATRP